MGIDQKLRSLVIKEQLEDIRRTLGRINISWDDCPVLEKSSFPSSYQTLTCKEKLLLWYAENFRRQVLVEYPKLPPLLLACENDCNIQKMVCTTINPSTTRYPELKIWHSCAQFVADHLTYVSLDRPLILPKTLKSPLTVLEQQTGHCFEYATVLASLLIGAGYDAYVVSGYASREICFNDNSRRECPCLSSEIVEEEEPADNLESKYKFDPPRQLISQYIQKTEEWSRNKLQEAQNIQMQAEIEAIRDFEKPPPDPLWSFRRHAWVLILPSKDLEEIKFIETTTGEPKAMNDPEYHGIDSLWNNVNYWIYIGALEKTMTCESINFELENPLHWERLLVAEPYKNRILDVGEEIDAQEKYIMLTMAEKHLDMPTSWTKKIDIPHSAFESRYPFGQKIIHYRKCTCELFSPFSQPSGLRIRKTLFKDYERTQIIEIREEYTDRADFLHSSVINYHLKNIREKFHRGRSDGLSEHLHPIDSNQVHSAAYFRFFSQSRSDGLVELITGPVIFKAKYEDRDDLMSSTHVHFHSHDCNTYHRQVERVIILYSRNLSIPVDEDVAIAEYNFDDHEVHLQFHYLKDRITSYSVVMSLGSKFAYASEYIPGILIVPPTTLCLYRLWKKYKEKAEEARGMAAALENKVFEILNLRKSEHLEPKLIISEYDEERNQDARERFKKKENEKRQQEEKELSLLVDVLEPYLVRFGKYKLPLSHDQAAQVYNDCLRDWKKILLDRASHIEQKLEKLNEELKQKQAELVEIRNRESMCEEEERTCLSAIDHLHFQIHCVNLQLARFKELAPLKYLTLNVRLQSDHRLRNLFL